VIHAAAGTLESGVPHALHDDGPKRISVLHGASGKVDVALGGDVFIDHLAFFADEIKSQFVGSVRWFGTRIGVLAAIAFEVAVVIGCVDGFDERVAPLAVVINLLGGDGQSVAKFEFGFLIDRYLVSDSLLAGRLADGIEVALVRFGNCGASRFWVQVFLGKDFFLLDGLLERQRLLRVRGDRTRGVRDVRCRCRGGR